MARIKGIQGCMQRRSDGAGLVKLEKKLQKELNYILGKEEIMWHQRSITEWLKGGDRNTKYYHFKTINRRRRNRITVLKDDNGVWIEDNEQLKELVNSFYRKLFALKYNWKVLHNTSISFLRLQESDLNNLKMHINDGEVKKRFLQ
ncbi:unnamed protein product [Lathyrus sativus]|nr:unnamed protein product [Lathyrus sativus]